jgi:hypothetical protein
LRQALVRMAMTMTIASPSTSTSTSTRAAVPNRSRSKQNRLSHCRTPGHCRGPRGEVGSGRLDGARCALASTRVDRVRGVAKSPSSAAAVSCQPACSTGPGRPFHRAERGRMPRDHLLGIDIRSADDPSGVCARCRVWVDGAARAAVIAARGSRRRCVIFDEWARLPFLRESVRFSGLGSCTGLSV